MSSIKPPGVGHVPSHTTTTPTHTHSPSGGGSLVHHSSTGLASSGHRSSNTAPRQSLGSIKEKAASALNVAAPVLQGAAKLTSKVLDSPLGVLAPPQVQIAGAGLKLAASAATNAQQVLNGNMSKTEAFQNVASTAVDSATTIATAKMSLAEGKALSNPTAAAVKKP